MSRIGKKPVSISDKVKVRHKENTIEVAGPKGTLNLNLVDGIKVDIKGDVIQVTRNDDTKKNKALHGLFRSLIQNMVTGVNDGFSKKLELIGIGYRAELKGKNLVMMLGFSHATVFNPPADINLEVPTPNTVVVNGINKELVGLVASKIRS
ncbi:MAG: 50S ribosomal protein L6, partial [bacterium]